MRCRAGFYGVVYGPAVDSTVSTRQMPRTPIPGRTIDLTENEQAVEIRALESSDLCTAW